MAVIVEGKPASSRPNREGTSVELWRTTKAPSSRHEKGKVFSGIFFLPEKVTKGAERDFYLMTNELVFHNT
jgi:hypothetical protein